VEGIGWFSTKSTWVSERSDRRQKFYKRSWPPMSDYKGKSIRIPGTNVDEMDSQSFDRRPELGESV
jgi:hypothetical protein